MIDFEKLFNAERKLWSGIVIHHSLTKDQTTNDWDSIKKYHLSSGWQDIGYHFGIERIGEDWTYQVGRPLSMTGAHTKGFNETHLGICVVGNFDNQPMLNVQKFLLCSLVREIQRMTGISKSNVIGHWESYIILGQANTQWEAQKIKTCPGLQVNMDKIRSYLL